MSCGFKTMTDVDNVKNVVFDLIDILRRKNLIEFSEASILKMKLGKG